VRLRLMRAIHVVGEISTSTSALRASAWYMGDGAS
jgi:hypothetical protein